MTNIKKIGVIGGDRRTLEVIRVLRQKGMEVAVWGIDAKYIDTLTVCDTFESTVNNAEAVILPTPPSEDEVRVNCPLFSNESGVKIHKLLEAMPENAILLGGRVSPRIKDLAAKRNVKCYDYFNTEELLIKNAVPTAEGAIGIAVDKILSVLPAPSIVNKMLVTTPRSFTVLLKTLTVNCLFSILANSSSISFLNLTKSLTISSADNVFPPTEGG